MSPKSAAIVNLTLSFLSSPPAGRADTGSDCDGDGLVAGENHPDRERRGRNLDERPGCAVASLSGRAAGARRGATLAGPAGPAEVLVEKVQRLFAAGIF